MNSLNPYGLDSATGKVVHVNDVARGLDCKAVCPNCQLPLVARQGDVRQWHFAHRAAPCDPDLLLHKTAQILLIERTETAIVNEVPVLIEWTCLADCNSANWNERHTGDLLKICPATSCAAEYRLPDIRPDIALLMQQDTDGLTSICGAIEIVVTHQPEYDAGSVGFPVLELQITGYDDMEKLRTGTIPIAKMHSVRCPLPTFDECEKCLRRKGIIDDAFTRMKRQNVSQPQFLPWYEGKRDDWGSAAPMYPKTQRQVFANAIILTELGFRQHNRHKPYLFRYKIHRPTKGKPVYLYADLGGSDVIPIYQDTAAMLYTFLPDDREGQIYDGHCHDIKQYLIDVAARSLQSFGVDVRVGFLSPQEITRVEMNPIKHIDGRMLAGLLRW